MPTAFTLPELGENIKSADVLNVLVKSGDVIRKDQAVVEIESEKATAEVPCALAGKIVEVRVKEGDKVKPGQVILTVEESGGAPAAAPKAEKPAEAREAKKEAPAPKPAEPAPAAPQAPAPAPASVSEKEPVFASPAVRQFAREIGVDIRSVTGSGPGGRISVEDVKDFARTGSAPVTAAARAAAAPLPDFSKFGEVSREPMNAVRRATATAMSRSWAEAPHVTVFNRADITDIEEIRQRMKAKAEAAGGKMTITAILLKVVAGALKTYPRLNASVDMAAQEVILKKFINIGVAADTARGLVVPVFRDVDKKSIIQLSVELTQVSEKARAAKLGINDLQGGTFTITNLGGLGTTYFSPIINHPEVAILGVGRATMEPVWQGKEFKPRLMMPLSLSFDHRVVDGADGARFLQWIVEAIENPLLLAM